MKQQQTKNGYWQNELRSLGIEPKEKKELNDKEELEKLADIIKHAMYIYSRILNSYLAIIDSPLSAIESNSYAIHVAQENRL